MGQPQREESDRHCSGLSAFTSGTMEGKWTSPSPHSEESSMLDLPSACDLAENFLPSNTTESSEEPCFFMDTLPSPPTGGNRLAPAVPGGSPGSGTEGGPASSPTGAALCEPAGPSRAALPWTSGHSDVGKALDSFYKTHCEAQPGGRDPTCEAGVRCLSQKISELVQQEGTKYAVRCLQMAQVVLNRDGCRVLPNHPSTTCFAAPTEGEVVLDRGTRTPGLSDAVMRLLSRQTRTGPGP